MKTTIMNTVKTSSDAKTLKDLFTTIEYNFSDSLGNFLFFAL